MLCYIIDAFESLINTQTLVDHSKEGSELLLDYVHDTEKGPQLLRLATWVWDTTLVVYLTKAKILFAELQGISTLLKAQGTIWHKAYISMSQMMGSYNNFIAGIEDGTEQPVNFVEAQSDFSAQFESLEELIKPYNDNIIQIWNKIQKFEPAYKSRVVKFYEVESLSDGLSLSIFLVHCCKILAGSAKHND